jgi:hypothetical protein
MSTILAILSLAAIVLIPGSMIICHLFCTSCRERHRQMVADARQMQVARDLMRLARKEKAEKEKAVIIIGVVNNQAAHQ